MAEVDWYTTVAKAQAVVGKEGKIPPPKADLRKYVGETYRTYDDYKKSVGALQGKILALQNALSAWRNALKQVDDQMSRESFGLDGKTAEGKRKIEQAQKILGDWLESCIKSADADIKNLDELDKHSLNVKKYKMQCGP
jgi:hypothetical protein